MTGLDAEQLRGRVTGIAERLRLVRNRIDQACMDAGREPASVRLLPVSKTRPVADLAEAMAAGYTLFGENRVQEVVDKAAELGPRGASFAVIGHLQTNKAKQVAQLAAEFQALDSVRVAAELDKRLQIGGRRLPVLVEVNSSGEDSKFGVTPREVVAFCEQLEPFDGLDVRGLMTVAVNSSDTAQVGSCFATMQRLQAELRQAGTLGSAWDELSMGMTGDLELAVAHGATTVRVGRAIFGERMP